MFGRRIRAAVAAAIAAMLLVSCGQQTKSTQSAGEAVQTTSLSPTKEPSPTVVEGRLMDTFTYDAESVRFDPAPTSYAPTESASDAYAIFAKSDAASYSPTLTHKKPEVFLADYTTIGAGPGVDKDTNEIGWDHVHSWIIRFTDVPSAAAGPAVSPDSKESPNDTIYSQDVVVVINAETGQLLTLYNAVPDKT